MDSTELIQKFLQDRLGTAPESIVPGARLVDLGLDSLMLAELMFEAEDRFAISIPSDLQLPNTVRHDGPDRHAARLQSLGLMSARRVAITGLGIVSPYGGGLDDFFQRLLAGESAGRHLVTDDVPRPLSIPFVGCPGFDAEKALGKPLALMMGRFSQLGVAAAFTAWDH